MAARADRSFSQKAIAPGIMRAREKSYPIDLTGKDIMTIKDDNERQRKVLLDRREALTCMTWAGTGLIWAMNGGRL